MPEGAEQVSDAVAYEARNIAKDAARDIQSHEEICAERYEGIRATLVKMENSFDKQLGMIWKILASVGGTFFTIIIGLLAFLAKTQWDANAASQSRADTKIEMLQQQRDRPPEIVVQQPLPRSLDDHQVAH